MARSDRHGDSGASAEDPVLTSPFMPRTTGMLVQGVLLVAAGLAVVAAAVLGFVQLWQQAATPFLASVRWWQWVLQSVIALLGVFVVVLGISGLAHRSVIRRMRPDPAHRAEGTVTVVGAVRRARTLTVRIDSPPAAHPESAEGTDLLHPGQLLRVNMDAGLTPVATSLRGKEVEVYLRSPERKTSQVLLRRRGTEDWCTGIGQQAPAQR